jgi:tellurite resistance protein TerC
MTGWAIFVAIVAGVLALDLFVVRRRSREIGMREALVWCAVWIGLALAFDGYVALTRGHRAGLEFLTAYLIEESLSVDNLFVFLLLFAHFGLPPRYRHKVLFWGILGALLMRFVFIVTGVSLLRRFEWVLYVFGAVLVVSGVRMARGGGPEVEPEKSLVLRGFRRLFPITPRFEGDRFFVLREGRRFATPLLVVLLMVETADLVFAVDSIPAVLGVSRDPFVVYTSNAFAILGLRSMFFALSRLLDAFHALHYGLALILVFVGLEMLGSAWVKVPTGVTLGLVGATIVVSVAASLLVPRRDAPPPG